MQPNNLTALDFEDIKASIKSYLRTREEFTDYDFDGSSLSYIIDLLAYNTYYTSFNANMAMNEAFLPSSTIRDNVVNIAKLMNYTPNSITAAKACVKLTIQTTAINGVYPSSITLKKGPVATGGNYIWNILSDRTTNVDLTTGQAVFDKMLIYEGNILNYSYIVNTFAKQVYAIPSGNVDTSTLVVRVRPNESSTASDLYNITDNITSVTSTTRVYFMHEGEDMRYEIRFGDDSIGRALKDGEVIDLEYLVTSGAEANQVKNFSFVGRLTDSNSATYSASTVILDTIDNSQQGEAAETIESIKYNAPRYLSSQNRAVTAQDYAVLTKKLYENAQAVVAYGGDILNPPIYGKVYIAILTKTGSELNAATKKEVQNLLRKYAMASIDPVVVDPDSLYINTKVFAQYDTGCGSNSSAIKTDIQNSIVDWAGQTQINNFNSTFRLNSYQKAIALANKCVSDVSVQTSLLKYITPISNQTNTYCVSIGSGLYDSNPSNNDGDGSDGSANQCKKEPVILSGTFRTYDRPGINQQFEDDGFGNLRMFYNTGIKKVYTNNAAGTVDYNTGRICFGPVNIIGTGSNIPDNTIITITDTVTGVGSITNEDLLPADLQLPVVTIPSNNATIPATTPGTILNIVVPEVTVAPIGTTPPPSIPLNSLTPTEFDQPPVTIEIPNIDNAGSLNTSSCF